MGESALKKALRSLSVLGSVDGRVAPGTAADYTDGVLMLDTPTAYPRGAYVEVFLGKPGVARGIEVLGRTHSDSGRLVIKPIVQVETVTDVGAMRKGALPRLPGELLNRENISNVIRKLDNLPTLPVVVAKILELTINDKATVTDLAQVIGKDPVLSAELLRLANSAYYGLEQQVATVDRAVVVLGFNRVRMAALTISVLRMWARAGKGASESIIPGLRFDEQAFWQHCLGVAAGAEALAQSLGLLAGESAFVAGLFHDIGKVVSSQYLSPVFARVLAYSRQNQCALHEAERKTAGITHEDVGQWLASAWKLPEFIQDATERHHRPDKPGTGKASTVIVHLADVLARALGLGCGGDPLVPAPDADVWNAFGFSDERLWQPIETFFRNVVKSSVFFSMMAGGTMPETLAALIEGGGRSQKTIALAEQILSRPPQANSVQARTVLKSMVKVLARGGWTG